MKTQIWILAVGLFLSLGAQAQGTIRGRLDRNQFFLTFGFWNWTERMTLTQGVVQSTDWANFQANSFGVGYRGVFKNWGYDLEALALAGKAVGGGNSNEITYKQSNFNFDGYGGKAAVYYRTERFIELGVSLPVIFRNVQWDTINPNLKVRSGSNPLITMMATWRLRPTKNFLIEQGFGPAGVPSQTIWNFQASLLF